MKRSSRAALAAALPLAAGLVFAGQAHADTEGYLNYLRNHGISNAESYLGVGQQQCQALRSGASERTLIGQLEHQMSRAESGLVVTGAHQYLCPGA